MSWTLRELKRALGLDAVGADADLGDISIDSRTLKKGDVYLALKREKDGHDYIESALDAGASFAISERKSDASEAQVLVVPSTEKALSDLAEAKRDWCHVQRIAVTGSVGKTTCKDMLSMALGAYASVKSFNNHIGVPLTLANIPSSTRVGVFEIGMNHPGEILPLAELVQPHVAIITSVAPAHIGAFESVADIAVEKFSILHGLDEGGVCITTSSCYQLYKNYVPEGVRVLLTSSKEDEQADAQVMSLKKGGDRYTLVVSVMDELHTLSVTDVAPAFLENALLTLLTVKRLGGSMEKAIAALENYTPVEGRGDIHDVTGVDVIDESYNANPLSMRVALERALSLKKEGGRVYAIVGQMGELGTQSKGLHMSLADTVEKFDGVWVVGPEAMPLFEELPDVVKQGFYQSADELPYREISSLLQAGDIIVIKGSKVVTYTTGVVSHVIESLKQKAKEKHAV